MAAFSLLSYLIQSTIILRVHQKHVLGCGPTLLQKGKDIQAYECKRDIYVISVSLALIRLNVLRYFFVNAWDRGLIGLASFTDPKRARLVLGINTSLASC